MDRIGLGILGASERTRQTLEYLFKSHAQGHYDLQSASNPQIILIDLDGVNAVGQWRAYHQQHPVTPALGFSVTDTRVEGIHTQLKKPLQSSVLLKALDCIARDLPADDSPPTSANQTLTTAQTAPAAATPQPDSGYSPDLDGTQELDRDELEKAVASAMTTARSSAQTDLHQQIPPIEPAVTSPTVKPQHIDPSPRLETPQAAASPVPQPAQAELEETAFTTSDDIVDITHFSMVVEDQAIDLTRFAEFCGERGDINPNSQDEVQSVQFEREKTLLDTLLAAWQAVKAQQTQQLISFTADRHLRLTPDGYIRTNMADEQLRKLCLEPERVLPASAENPQPDDEQLAIQMEEEQCIWKVALWTSHGRVPTRTDLNSKVCLKYWPNLTRLIEVPDALRIVALWMVQPMSLIHTAEALAIPQRHVFALYTACDSLGLVTNAQRDSDELLAVEAPPKPRRNRILSMMARHLGLLRKHADD